MAVIMRRQMVVSVLLPSSGSTDMTGCWGFRQHGHDLNAEASDSMDATCVLRQALMAAKSQLHVLQQCLVWSAVKVCIPAGAQPALSCPSEAAT